MLIYFLLYSLIIMLGLSVGSFLHCIVYRLENKKDMSGRSFCEHCKHVLSWQDLIPVLSFFLLEGKCRYCKAKVSFWHPLIELLTGLIFLLVFVSIVNLSSFGLNDFPHLIFAFYIASSLIIIFIYDLKHYLIPDKALIPAIIVSILFNFFIASHASLFWFFASYLVPGLILFGLFFFIFFISKGRWLGFGDVKFVFFMGVLLGFAKSFLALFVASLMGSVIGILLIVAKKKQLKSTIPFGPFLAIGTFLMMIFGNAIENLFSFILLP